MQFLTYLILKILIFYFQRYSQLPKICLNHLKIFDRNELFLCWIFMFCYIMAQRPLAKLSLLGVLGNTKSKDYDSNYTQQMSALANPLAYLYFSFITIAFQIKHKDGLYYSDWITIFDKMRFWWDGYGRGCWTPSIQSFDSRIYKNISFTILYMHNCLCKNTQTTSILKQIYEWL